MNPDRQIFLRCLALSLRLLPEEELGDALKEVFWIELEPIVRAEDQLPQLVVHVLFFEDVEGVPLLEGHVERKGGHGVLLVDCQLP